MASIRCTNGKVEHTHGSVEEVRMCYQGKLYQNGQWSQDPLQSPAVTRPVDASAPPRVTTPPTPPPAAVPYAMQPRTSVPLAMLETTPDGYYAVQLDETDAYRFLRISRRFGKRSKWLGCIQVQSQHSDDLKPLLMYRPLDAEESVRKDEFLWVSQPHMEKYVILAMVDPIRAGQKYASELGRCMICGKTLTDERSRHYGIGPECEKTHTDIIEYVDGLNAEENDA